MKYAEISFKITTSISKAFLAEYMENNKELMSFLDVRIFRYSDSETIIYCTNPKSSYQAIQYIKIVHKLLEAERAVAEWKASFEAEECSAIAAAATETIEAVDDDDSPF